MAFNGKRLSGALALVCIVVLSACTSLYDTHGYVPPEEELNALAIGADSRSSVDDTIGPPSAEGMIGGGDYYYVRTRLRTFGAFRPEVVERRVVAISFDKDDTIANIEQFGLERGQVVYLTRRTTNNSVAGKGFLAQLLGNVGKLDAKDVF